MTDHAVSLPAVPGIDLEYRPASYFWPLGLETHLLSRIKGAERKAALQRLIDAGCLDEIPDFLAQSALSADERRAIGRLHPAFMGGEYLPDMAQNEVIIARIVRGPRKTTRSMMPGKSARSIALRPRQHRHQTKRPPVT